MIEVENKSVCHKRLTKQSLTYMLCPSVEKNLTVSFRSSQMFMDEWILKTSLFGQRSSKILAGSLSKSFENSQGSWSLWRSYRDVWRS